MTAKALSGLLPGELRYGGDFLAAMTYSLHPSDMSANHPVKTALISIIDDDEPTRSAVAALMRAKGFTPSTFESAEGFLDARAQDRSNCVITDIFMSGLSGIELKQRLNEDACAVPVIMISARLEERLEDEAVASGAFCVLQKPFKAQTLLAWVERALNRS